MSAASSRPASVSGRSVRPVCAPERLHSVSPCRTSQSSPAIPLCCRMRLAFGARAAFDWFDERKMKLAFQRIGAVEHHAHAVADGEFAPGALADNLSHI